MIATEKNPFEKLDDALLALRSVEKMLKGPGEDPMRVVARETPFEIDISDNNDRVVIVAKGHWTFTNGKFSRRISRSDTQTVPAHTAAKLITTEVGSEFICVDSASRK